jgi:hypothetical protein
MKRGDPSGDNEKPQAPEDESALPSGGVRAAASKRAQTPRRRSAERTRSRDSTEQESRLPDTLESAIATKRSKAKRAREAPGAMRFSELKAFLDQRNRDVQLIEAVLIAVRFAIDHECEFDAADAVGGVVVLVGHVLRALDQGEVSIGREVSNGK